MSELKNLIESLLFSAGKRLTIEELSRLSKEENIVAIKEALAQLKKELDDKQSSLMLVEEGNAYKLAVREKYIHVVKKVVTTPELPKSILETLAVVAYKAPVMQSAVIKIRTNKAYRHLDELEEMGYISREKKGRSKLIKLTPKFFDYFDVPPEKLKEKFKNVAVLEKAIEEKEGAIQQTQQAIVKAATEPQVEVVTEELPKLPEIIEPYGNKVGELETYGEAPKPKKKHKHKKHVEETAKTQEDAAEALAEQILGEAGIEPTPEEAEAIEEEGRWTVEKIKKEAAQEKPHKTEYVPKGIFAEGVPEEVKERIEHRVAELLEGEKPEKETEEELAQIPETIPAPPEEEQEMQATDETSTQEKEQPEETNQPEKQEVEETSEQESEETITPEAEKANLEQKTKIHEQPSSEEQPKKHKRHH